MIIKTPLKDRICGRMRVIMDKEKKDNQNKTTGNMKKTSSKQVVAIGGITLLVLMYLITLIVAIVDNSESGRWFMGCIFATMAVPLLIWVYIWMYGKLTGRHTIADAERGLGSDPAAARDETSPETPDHSSASR